MYCRVRGEGKTCLSFASSAPSVSQLGLEDIHKFMTQAKANHYTHRSEPRGATLYVSGLPVNVQLLCSASPRVLHDCSFKRSHLILYITPGAKGHSSKQRGTLGKQDAERLWRRQGEVNLLLPAQCSTLCCCCMTAPAGHKVMKRWRCF